VTEPNASLPVEARSLVKRYGHVVAVAGIDLNVRAGDIYGFLGPNGGFRVSTRDAEEPYQ
jgi:ABC-2 type transport system ATP-binding protein